MGAQCCSGDHDKLGAGFGESAPLNQQL